MSPSFSTTTTFYWLPLLPTQHLTPSTVTDNYTICPSVQSKAVLMRWSRCMRSCMYTLIKGCQKVTPCWRVASIPQGEISSAPKEANHSSAIIFPGIIIPGMTSNSYNKGGLRHVGMCQSSGTTWLERPVIMFQQVIILDSLSCISLKCSSAELDFHFCPRASLDALLRSTKGDECIPHKDGATAVPELLTWWNPDLRLNVIF